MTSAFTRIPPAVVDYIRSVFATANDKVSRTMCVQPSMYEETLDHTLIMELSASPSAFFAQERMAVSLQSHWLGSRHMYGRWEIADIAFFLILRRQGRLVARKVVLLQTKRLYSREIAVDYVDAFDYRVGIGRIVDSGEAIVSHPGQRKFRFDKDCKYEALRAGTEGQASRIDAYAAAKGIPVYYGLYNPLTVPFESLYPALNGVAALGANELGMRILEGTEVHNVLSTMTDGASPTLDDLKSPQVDAVDPLSVYGWRLETFMADEVLSCRQGKLFDEANDPNLRTLLYERSAPIQAAIAITIDLVDQ